MIKIVKEFFSSDTKPDQSEFNTQLFNDEVADKTRWEPLYVSTSNFKTKILESAHGSSLKYKTTIGMRIFISVFIACGILILFLTRSVLYEQWNDFSMQVLIGMLACLLFVALGITRHHFRVSPIVFDHKQSLFIKGRGNYSRKIPFSKIHALQLIFHPVVNTDGPDYDNYQLNLVLPDAERIHVVNYFDIGQARDDAAAISAMAGIILWDAT